MNTRETLISKGKIWVVYPDGKYDEQDILFEGTKAKCLAFIKEKFGKNACKNGSIRAAKVILENN
jgi:hypothetical protein